MNVLTLVSWETKAPLEAHLGFWLRFVSNHVSIRFQQLLEEEGVTVTEWVALRTFWSQIDTTHAELIQAPGMTKGAASKVVSRLEEKGLAGPADANDAHFFGHLPAADRQALTQALQALVQHHQLKDITAA